MKRAGLAILFAAIMSMSVLRSAAASEDAGYQGKKEMVKNLVNEAADLIRTKGQDGIDIITDEKGKFNKGDIYIFVTSGETGADLVNPAFRVIEGLPVENYPDSDTRAAQMTIVNAVKDLDTAWVEYLWPKPGQTKTSRKVAYLRKVMINGKTRIVGAGFYPESDYPKS